jgi:hypothetical protein
MWQYNLLILNQFIQSYYYAEIALNQIDIIALQIWDQIG